MINPRAYIGRDGTGEWLISQRTGKQHGPALLISPPSYCK